MDNLHVVKNNMFPVPPLFKMIKKQSDTSWKEMYQVFNMGHRMELYVEEQVAQQIINIAGSFNLEAQVIGYCEKADKEQLTIKTEHGIFSYNG